MDVNDIANLQKDILILKVTDALNKFFSKVDDTIKKQREEVEACKKKNELESQVAAQLKLHEELERQRAGARGRHEGLARLVADMGRKLTIADSDHARLATARELYEVGRELTGVRWDFSAPPHLARGYVKSECRKILQPFQLVGDVERPLWQLVGGADLPPSQPTTLHPPPTSH